MAELSEVLNLAAANRAKLQQGRAVLDKLNAAMRFNSAVAKQIGPDVVKLEAQYGDLDSKQTFYEDQINRWKRVGQHPLDVFSEAYQFWKKRFGLGQWQVGLLGIGLIASGLVALGAVIALWIKTLMEKSALADALERGVSSPMTRGQLISFLGARAGAGPSGGKPKPILDQLGDYLGLGLAAAGLILVASFVRK